MEQVASERIGSAPHVVHRAPPEGGVVVVDGAEDLDGGAEPRANEGVPLAGIEKVDELDASVVAFQMSKDPSTQGPEAAGSGVHARHRPQVDPLELGVQIPVDLVPPRSHRDAGLGLERRPEPTQDHPRVGPDPGMHRVYLATDNENPGSHDVSLVESQQPTL